MFPISLLIATPLAKPQLGGKCRRGKISCYSLVTRNCRGRKIQQRKVKIGSTFRSATFFRLVEIRLKLGVHGTIFSAREENALEFFPHQRIGEFPNRAAFPSRCLLQEENSAFLLRKSVLFRYQTVSVPLFEVFIQYTCAME